jgi:hypothetical protein
MYGRGRVVGELLDNAASVIVRDQVWALHSNSKTSKLQPGATLAFDCPPRSQDGDTPLHNAASSTSVEAVRLLVGGGVDIRNEVRGIVK